MQRRALSKHWFVKIRNVNGYLASNQWFGARMKLARSRDFSIPGVGASEAVRQHVDVLPIGGDELSVI